MEQVSLGAVRSTSVRAGVVLVLLAGTLLGVGPAPAAAQDTTQDTTVSGGAFAYSTAVSLFGGPVVVRGHGQPADAPASSVSPAVVCPEGGGDDQAFDADGARAEYGPGVLFGGIWPEEGLQAPPSGPLSAAIDCGLDDGGHVTASTSVTLMPTGTAWTTPGGRAQLHPGGVGPGPFVVEEVHASCTATSQDMAGAVTIVGGVLEAEYHPGSQLATVLTSIPEHPAPNTTYDDLTDRVGDRYRLTLNRQVVEPDGTLTVNAAHIQFLGPTAVGEILIGQAQCRVTAAPDPGPVAPSQQGHGVTPDTAAAAVSPTEGETPAAPKAAAGASVAKPSAPVQASQVNPRTTTGAGEVLGEAYNYSTEVSLFGGPANRRGFGQPGDAPASAASPAAVCPDGGGTDSATAPNGASAQYGPATIFGGIWPDGAPSAPPSGPLTSAVECTPGERITASTSVTRMPGGTPHPGGVGPGPVVADEVHSSCTATPRGITGEVRVVNGVLELRYDTATQSPAATEPIPASPSPNYTRSGTLDHVGDSYRVTFNQQIQHADGSLTVNAVHIELLGPTAVGEMVIGSSTCGVVAAAAGSVPGGTDGQRETTSGRAAAGQGTSGSTARGTLARTGSDPLPLAVLGLGLMLTGTLALQGRRVGRAAARLRRE